MISTETLAGSGDEKLLRAIQTLEAAQNNSENGHKAIVHSQIQDAITLICSARYLSKDEATSVE